MFQNLIVFGVIGLVSGITTAVILLVTSSTLLLAVLPGCIFALFIHLKKETISKASKIGQPISRKRFSSWILLCMLIYLGAYLISYACAGGGLLFHALLICGFLGALATAILFSYIFSISAARQFIILFAASTLGGTLAVLAWIGPRLEPNVLDRLGNALGGDIGFFIPAEFILLLFPFW